MTVGDKIKIIRTFRGMTQKQLAMAAGLGNKGADNRIAQYEINYRAPKKELLDQMSKALHVNPQNFYDHAPGSMEAFFPSSAMVGRRIPWCSQSVSDASVS